MTVAKGIPHARPALDYRDFLQLKSKFPSRPERGWGTVSPRGKPAGLRVPVLMPTIIDSKNRGPYRLSCPLPWSCQSSEEGQSPWHSRDRQDPRKGALERSAGP